MKKKYKIRVCSKETIYYYNIVEVEVDDEELITDSMLWKEVKKMQEDGLFDYNSGEAEDFETIYDWEFFD